MTGALPTRLPLRPSKKTVKKIDKNPIVSAKSVGLRYVSDTVPGYARKRSGKGFSYYTPDGSLCKDKEVLQRIKSLGIPPAWVKVWICADEKGHLQATGIDSKGRKQYRYHTGWSQIRNTNKYHLNTTELKSLPNSYLLCANGWKPTWQAPN